MREQEGVLREEEKENNETGNQEWGLFSWREGTSIWKTLGGRLKKCSEGGK